VIFRKFVGLVAALAAIAAAAAVCMVALAFALYAGLREVVGPAWAAAGVAGVVALIALILAFAVTRKARPKPAKGDSQNLTAQLIELARERPLVALGVVGAAAAVVIKNPRILGAVVAGLFTSRPSHPPKR
jgi:Na+/melibiose symporter-like transporter